MRLTVETGPLAGTVVPLNRDEPATLGSGEDCALRVQEAGVLPHHAVVKALRNEGFGLKALGPGVRVNGEQIEATPLADGDVIQLGTTRIAFGETQKKGLPTIAGYRILEELGRGGMGVVYRAEQVSLHRQVALKVLSHELTEDAKFTTNFVAEAQAAAKLQHPNVVSVFDVEHDGGTYYYAMELMQNGSCEDWLKQNGAMPHDRALQVIADAAAGLAYAESLGIVHRDIKPDNLMLDQHGVVKIADLGLAGADPESEDRAIGTPHFMAPEQVLRKTIDHRSDIYALGCTFYRLVTGRTPFRGQTVKDILRAQVKDDPEPANKVNNKVPAEVAALIQRMMQKEPGDRFQTANDLVEEVEILLRPPAKKGLWIGLAAAAVLVGAIAIWWGVTKKGEETIIEKYRDNPEMLKLATENERLLAAAVEDRATIALLTARVSGLADEPLAAALERVANENPNTPAATEATERAARIREDVRERAAREQRRLERIDGFVAELEKSLAPQLLAHDYALAMQTLAGAPPSELEGDSELTGKIEALRAGVITKARERLAELERGISEAEAANDPAALASAVDLLADNIAASLRWPEPVRGELAACQQHVDRGRQALAAQVREKREGLWERYGALFGSDGAVAAAMAAGRFGDAATAVEQFAANSPKEEAGARAASFAAAARLAGTFADELAAAAAAGKLQHEFDDGTALDTARWDRDARTMVFVDPKARPTKERAVPAAELSVDDWTAFADQTAALTGKSAEVEARRDAFLALLLLQRHAAAAASYLAALQPADDNSGTGDAGYPLTLDAFAILLRRLPDAGEPWLLALRRELQAGERLVGGLRALSERRNIAAAGHLEQLLTEHAHSYLVLALP